jgi:hypothetical protein
MRYSLGLRKSLDNLSNHMIDCEGVGVSRA